MGNKTCLIIYNLQLSNDQTADYSQNEILRTTPSTRTNRRRPIQRVNTLTSSDVAAKYNVLLDKRLVLVEKQIENIDNEMEFLNSERKLKLELLKLQISNEKMKNNPNSTT